MATKKFIIEIENGITKCKDCEFCDVANCPVFYSDEILDCNKYNLATMKIKKLEKEK